MKQTAIILVCLIALAGGIGCTALSYLVTPATLDQRAIRYAEKAGVIEPNVFAGYQNLEKAIRLEAAVKSAHEVKQLAFQQLSEKDQLDYAQLNQITTQNTKIALQREETLFGPQGLLSIGLTAAGFGTLTGLLGLMRKRPGDITPEEMESALESVSGELSDKEQQMLSIIRGVQNFLNADQEGKGPNATALKSALSAVTDTKTKMTIATLKTKENL